MRRCGECTACCSALAVAELNKPRYRACDHICPQGCAVYAARPQSCADYHCLWLDGHLREADRPDRLGVIFTVTADPEHPERGNIPMLVEYHAGALEKPRVLAAIAQLTARKPVVVITREGRSVLPPHETDAVVDRVVLTLHGVPAAVR